MSFLKASLNNINTSENKKSIKIKRYISCPKYVSQQCYKSIKVIKIKITKNKEKKNIFTLLCTLRI